MTLVAIRFSLCLCIRWTDHFDTKFVERMFDFFGVIDADTVHERHSRPGYHHKRNDFFTDCLCKFEAIYGAVIKTKLSFVWNLG